MPSFTNLLIVMAVAFTAPLLLGLFPRLLLPSVVLEIVAGIVVGPSVLGWVEVDEAVEVIALLGLAFVLFLAGLEIEFEKLRGRVLRLTLLGFAFGGVAHGLKNVLLRTLIHERVPEALRGRAFAAYNGARNGAELGALALGGIVVGAFGARVALLASGLGPALIGLACLLFLTTPTIQRRTIDARVQG